MHSSSHLRVWAGAAALTLLVARPGLPNHARPQQSLQPAGWSDALALAPFVDVNPDPHIVEGTLDARVATQMVGGHAVAMWTYNGTMPGPLIRAQVGDRVIVHFSNHLPQSTTVHWHGVRVPIAMDGVPGISQPPVEPGGVFTYDFVVPDAGLFWYHPHVMSAAQVGFGLSGALLVEDPAEARSVGVADELVLVLNDIALDKRGMLEDPNSGGSAGMAFGREGTNVLVNGREGATLTVRAGAPQRWRIVNTAKSRYFQLDLPNEQFTIIGGDGGLQEYATTVRRLVLAPGERADVLVTPHAKPGTSITLRSLLYDRGYGSTEYRDDSSLLTLTMAAQPAYAGAARPAVRRPMEPLSRSGATPVEVKLTLAQRNDGLFEYGFDGVPGHKAERIRAKPGETQLWTVSNATPWSHPLHLHGFFFQAADEQGNPIHPIAWKDTYDIPYKQTRRLLVRFDDRAGEWMYHCHILDHADGGLMSTVLLGDVKGQSH